MRACQTCQQNKITFVLIGLGPGLCLIDAVVAVANLVDEERLDQFFDVYEVHHKHHLDLTILYENLSVLAN